MRAALPRRVADSVGRREPLIKKNLMTRSLAAVALMAGNFIIGTTVLAPAGMIGELARDLGVTVSQAGLLVTFGAVVLCFGSPLVAWATTRLDRRLLLSLTLLIIAIGHAASAFAPGYWTLLAVRLIMLAVAAIYTPQAASTIALIVPEAKRSGAIAFVFLGWSLALAIGLPLVTFMTAHLGWRETSVVLAAMSIVGGILVALGVPSGVTGAPMSLHSWGVIARNRLIGLLLLITLLTTAGQFTLFIYLGPILVRLVDAGSETIAAFFAIGGIAGAIGNVVATRVVGGFGTLRTSLVFQVTMFIGLLVWSLGAGSVWLMAVGMTGMGLGMAAANSMQQARLAGAAPDLASGTIALNTSSIYIGQALGSWVGGLLIARDLAIAMGYVAAGCMGLTLVVIGFTRPKTGRKDAQPIG